MRPRDATAHGKGSMKRGRLSTLEGSQLSNHQIPYKIPVVLAKSSKRIDFSPLWHGANAFNASLPCSD